MIIRQHELIGKVFQARTSSIGWFCGMCRKIDAVDGQIRSVWLQRANREASTLSASYRGEMLRVPIEQIVGVINRRRSATKQIESLTKEQIMVDYRARALKAAATRRANKEKAKTPEPKAEKPKVEARAKKEKPTSLCLCGCGAVLVGKRFVQGHDAKLHSQVAQAVKAGTKLSASLAKLAGEYIRQRWPKEAKEVL